ncbi:MAG: hypothetical protein ACPG31_04945 [Planctomycetota bacterium]
MRGSVNRAKSVCFLITGLCGLLGCAVPSAPASLKAELEVDLLLEPSRMVFAVDTIDLGEVLQHHTRELVYPFEVLGEVPITLSGLDSETGITRVMVRPDWDPDSDGAYWPLERPIPAGAKGAIVGTFESGRYRNEKQSSIRVFGDFQSGQIELKMHSFVKAVFEVSPFVVQFGELKQATLAMNPQELILRVEAPKPFMVLRWKRLPPGITVERRYGDNKLGNGRIDSFFTIAAGAEIPLGRMSSSVIAETSLGVDMEFLINASVVGAVKYVPSSRVAFGIFDHGKARKRTVTVESTRNGLQLPAPSFELQGDAAKVMQA